MENPKNKKRATKSEMIVLGKPNHVKVVNGDINSALKMWKQNMKANEKIDILKAKKEYLKPSIVNRKKKSDAKFNQWLLDKHYKENNGI
jgi:ribosomal protein S21